MCRKILKIAALMIAIPIILISSYGVFVISSYADEANIPPLKNGDLVFQTTGSGQSTAIMVSTFSPYTHMGMIKISGNKAYVVEAVGPVKETPLDQWIQRGDLQRIAIMRDKNLLPEKAEEILVNAKAYYGRGYDIYFYDDNKEIYCSELVYLSYKKAGLELGEKQTIGELFINNSIVKNLIKKRLRTHPICQSNMSDDDCWANVMEEELVTPSSIANDNNLSLIYTNYTPFN